MTRTELLAKGLIAAEMLDYEVQHGQDIHELGAALIVRINMVDRRFGQGARKAGEACRRLFWRITEASADGYCVRREALRSDVVPSRCIAKADD